MTILSSHSPKTTPHPSSRFKRRRSLAAETMAEVILAITIFVFGAGGSTGLMLSTLKSNRFNADTLIAYNLAREGVEAIRNLRDTNLLRFPGNPEECWDTLEATDPTDCSGSDKLGMIDNTIPFGEASPSDWTPYLVYPELTNPTRLFDWNIQGTFNPGDELIYQETINNSPNNSPFFTHFGSSGNETQFSRIVSIYKPSISSPDPEQLTVSATVTWESEGKTKEVTFNDRLLNFLE